LLSPEIGSMLWIAFMQLKLDKYIILKTDLVARK